MKKKMMDSFLWSLVLALTLGASKTVGLEENDMPTTTLRDGQEFPLVGLGVGNLQHELIVGQISKAMEAKIRLIDTAHASYNENIVNDGVVEGLRRQSRSTGEHANVNLHVVTKVWYTYLGYERTKISARESLQLLKNPNIQVTILLHWPRCRDDIPWMNCEQEEEGLPPSVKKAGPPPHLDKANAFKESWRALEDIYLGEISLGEGLPQINSIGVSNFAVDDLHELSKTARIMPHLLQDNVWTFIFDPFLIDYCHSHHIHYQAYNVMNGILSRSESSPIAYSALQAIADEVARDSFADHVEPSQVILKWLIQRDVSVIPRTSSSKHLVQNSAVALAELRDLTDREQQKAKDAIEALLRGRDLKPPQANFVNHHAETVLHLFWRSSEGNEVPVREGLRPGESFDTTTYPGHVFVAYDESKSQRREFTISASYGEKEQFHIEEL